MKTINKQTINGSASVYQKGETPSVPPTLTWQKYLSNTFSIAGISLDKLNKICAHVEAEQ